MELKLKVGYNARLLCITKQLGYDLSAERFSRVMFKYFIALNKRMLKHQVGYRLIRLFLCSH